MFELLISGALIASQAAFTAWLVRQAKQSPPRPSESPPGWLDWRDPESWWAENHPEIRDAGLEKERDERQHRDPLSFGYEGRSKQKYSGHSASLGGKFQAWKPKDSQEELS